MKIDPKMMKEIDKSIDGFIKKNKIGMDNAKLLETFKKEQTSIGKDNRKDIQYLLGKVQDLLLTTKTHDEQLASQMGDKFSI